MRMNVIGAAALALTVAACGYTREDRVTGGAATGAATGAAVGALGGPPGMLAGAAIGGVAGGVTGAATTPSEVNLGRPVWNNPEVRVGGSQASGTRTASRGSASVRRTQQDLASRGLYDGPIDGVMGPQTRAAMARSQTGTGSMSGSSGPGTGMSGSGSGSSYVPPPSGSTMPPTGTSPGTVPVR